MESRDILIEGKDRVTIIAAGENAPVYEFGVAQHFGPYAQIKGVLLLTGNEASQLAWAVFDCVQFELTSKYSKAFVKMLNRMDEWEKRGAEL